MYSPVPTYPFNTPSTVLTIKLPPQPEDEGLHNTSPRQQLRLKIINTLLIPSPPFSEYVYGKGLEDNVEVVIPVGGSIGLDIAIEDDGLEAFRGKREWEKDLRIRDEIKDRSQAALLKNIEVLGLSNVSRRGLFDVPDSGGEEPEIKLVPNIANPTLSPLTKNLIPTGMPVAYLTKVSLVLSWSGVSKASAPTASTGDSVSVGEGLVKEVDNEILGDDDEDADIPSDESQGSAVPMTETANIESDSLGLPTWAILQLDESMQKFMKYQLIQRFPLIFDAGLYKYSSLFVLHRFLPDSLLRLLKQSTSTFNIQVEKDQEQNTGIKALMNAQDAALRKKVQAIVNLPTKKKPQKEDELPESQELGRGKRKRKPTTLKSQAEDMVMVPSDPVEEYMDLVEAMRKGEYQNERQSHDVSFRRALNNVVGRIGRNAWEEARRGRGKLSIHKIKFRRAYDDNDPTVTSSIIPTADSRNSVSQISPHNRCADDDDLIMEEEFEGDDDLSIPYIPLTAEEPATGIKFEANSGYKVADTGENEDDTVLPTDNEEDIDQLDLDNCPALDELAYRPASSTPDSGKIYRSPLTDFPSSSSSDEPNTPSIASMMDVEEILPDPLSLWRSLGEKVIPKVP